MTIFEYFTGCGISISRIVGGSVVVPHSVPWQVALVPVGGSRPFCGGTLISPRHVLTAANCMNTMQNFDIIVGGHDYTSSSFGTRHKVCRSVKHPSYYKDTMNCDFAIVHLKTPVHAQMNATPACLPSASWGGEFLAGKNLVVSGWGFLSPGGSQPDRLHSVNVPGITNAQCKELYSGVNEIRESMLCAGDVSDGGVDACIGDAGGR